MEFRLRDGKPVRYPDHCLKTECVHCGRMIVADDWRRNRVVGLFDSRGRVVAFCSDHLKDAKTRRRAIEQMVDKMRRIGMAIAGLPPAVTAPDEPRFKPEDFAV
jgi:hypothetical protein